MQSTTLFIVLSIFRCFTKLFTTHIHSRDSFLSISLKIIQHDIDNRIKDMKVSYRCITLALFILIPHPLKVKNSFVVRCTHGHMIYTTQTNPHGRKMCTSDSVSILWVFPHRTNYGDCFRGKRAIYYETIIFVARQKYSQQ